jgi:hypothetical protein
LLSVVCFPDKAAGVEQPLKKWQCGEQAQIGPSGGARRVDVFADIGRQTEGQLQFAASG